MLLLKSSFMLGSSFMSLPILLLIYCSIIVLASLAGGWLPSLVKLTHTRMQLMMSVVSGLMLGIALLHMLPQAAEHLSSMTSVSAALLAGLLVMFFLLRVFQVHSHGSLDDSEGNHNHAHGHGCDHNHPAESPSLNWVGLFFGLAIHTLLDGVALAASVVADADHMAHQFALYGLGTFLAVALHKPLDALAITSLMSTSGWSARSQTAVNLSYALMCPLGSLMFWLGVSQLAGKEFVVGSALAFSAGFFLCIALGDLLPEVQFHSHDRLKLSVALLLGVATAFGIELTHSHNHGATHGHHHEHNEEPMSLLADTIGEIKKHEANVTKAFDAGDPGAAHEGLHELGHLFAAISDLADKTAMSTDDRNKLKEAGEALFKAFSQIDETMHGKEASVEKATKVYAKVQEDIDAALQVLEAMLPTKM
jgi:zinc and cadmium transporter